MIKQIKAEQQKKVALYLPSLRGGGAERVMLNLAKGFADKGLETHLVLAKAEGSLLSSVPFNVRVVDLGKRRVLHSLPGLVRYLRQYRPTAMLSAMDHANVVALWGKFISRVNVRIVVGIHNNMSLTMKNSPNRKDKLRALLGRFFYPWADAVVTVSKGVACDFMQLTGLSLENVHIIYNPIVTPELLEKANESLDHPWFRPGEPPVVLGVGRLSEQKDFFTLIRAFALVRKNLPARLMILGEGKDRSKLETLVKKLGLGDDVALPGFVDNPYKYMKQATVFVLSSRWEGFGNVLVETLAIGTPVVSTDCPSGPKEILEDGKWGRLVPVGDVEALALSIQDALSENASRKMPLESYTLDNVTDRYLEVLGLLS